MSRDTKKKTDKQIFRRWVLVMILAFVGGGVGGFFSVPISEWVKENAGKLVVNAGVITYTALIIFALLNIVCIIFTFCYYEKTKRMAEEWNGEDEEQIEIIEKKIDYAMIPLGIIPCVNQFLFAATFYMGFDMLRKDMDFICSILSLVIFIATSLVYVALQKKLVDLTKKLNPEKQGNVLDKNFTDEWLASCDEAQQLLIYKCSYKAYKAVASACNILWFVTFVGMLSFDTGLLPIFCVSLIMTVMQITYMRESMKLEHKK